MRGVTHGVPTYVPSSRRTDAKLVGLGGDGARVALIDRRAMAAGGTLVLGATVVTSALGVAYTIAMARLLSPAEYATLVTLLSVLGVAGLPAGPMQAVVARVTALSIGQGATDPTAVVVRAFRARIGGIAVSAVALGAFSVPWLAGFLQIDDASLVWMAVPVVGLGLVQPLLRGLAQGRSRFGLLAGAAIIDIGAKVAGGIGLASVGFAVRGALVAMLAGGIGSFLFVLGAFRRERLGRTVADSNVSRGLRKSTTASDVATFLAFGGLTSLVTLDAVLVKHQFAPDLAATFAVLSVAGRSLFWATGAITTVLLPVVARDAGAGKRGRGALWTGLALATVVAGSGELAFVMAPNLVVSILFGPVYAQAAPLLPIFGLGSLCLSLASVVLTWLVGQGRRAGAIIVPLAAIAQAVTILSGPDGLAESLVRIVAVSGATLAALLVTALVQPRDERQSSGPVAE